MKSVTVKGPQKSVTFANDKPFGLICGPCAIESRDMIMQSAEHITKIADKLGIEVVFKSSFDKANRSSLKGDRGVGAEEGLRILEEVRQNFGVPIITDIHETAHVDAVAEVADILQIPAFLCRQTDLLLKAASTGKALNVKKGQFLAPADMANIVAKVESTNNPNLMLCERGTTFGYGNLVSDMRSLRIMAETEYPVVFDVTHSVQMPGGNGTSSGGQRQFAEPLARAAVAVGVGGLFIEAHPDPSVAISDAANQIPLSELEGLLRNLKTLDDISKETAYRKIA